MIRARELVLAPLLAIGVSSCVSFRWDRASVNSPISKATIARLEPGKSSLSECLDVLGAPVIVWERPRGAALAWGWSYAVTRGITLSVPLDRGGSLSASYDDVANKLRGVVLFFDEGWTLRDVRRGYLEELRRTGRARPPAPSDSTEREAERDPAARQ